MSQKTKTKNSARQAFENVRAAMDLEVKDLDPHSYSEFLDELSAELIGRKEAVMMENLEEDP